MKRAFNLLTQGIQTIYGMEFIDIFHQLWPPKALDSSTHHRDGKREKTHLVDLVDYLKNNLPIMFQH